MASLAGKVIAVTGAASGIGRSTALLLAKHGAILSLSDTNQAGLEETVKQIESNAKAKTMHTVVDVRNSAQVKEWIEKTVSEFGKLDGAANVAGIYRPVPLLHSTPEDWDLTMDVNARGVFNCLCAELANIKDGGSVVNVASVAGVRGISYAPIYAASKHAVIGLSKSCALDLGPRKIRVNAVAPGTVDTPLLDEVLKQMGGKLPPTGQCLDRAANPGEIATVIGFLLSDDASFVTGAVWTADGGFTA